MIMVQTDPIRGLFLLVLALSMSATACSDPAQLDRRIPVVQLASHAASVSVGDTVRLSLLPMLPPGYVPSVTWSSSNPATASVESAGSLGGRVAGLQPGQAVITAAGEAACDSAVVTVVGAAG
jgi:hypothetical protein